MITNYKGSEYTGAPSLQTSVAGAEVIVDNMRLYNFTFTPDQPCTVKINGSTDAIYIKAAQKILLPICASFKIVEGGITYNWMGQLA